MRKLARFHEPAVLLASKDKWLDAFLLRLSQDLTCRPPSAQYAHEQIKQVLRDMSMGKCFYCERKLTEREEEVDHYREVAERPELAFVWANLYLACEGCNNGKPRNRDIPVEECVDPCDPGDDPVRHFQFQDEMIVGIPGTKGTRTVNKYRLNREELAYQRAKSLIAFGKILQRIMGEVAVKMRRTPSLEQVTVLRRFAEPDMPFSTMFSAMLGGIPAVSGKNASEADTAGSE